MRNYTATICLRLAPFAARNTDEADRIINGYVDLLANAQAIQQQLDGVEVTWPSVDWHYDHVDADIVCECGNTPNGDGFFPCTGDGVEIEPTLDSDWQGQYRCAKCSNLHTFEGGEG